MEIGQYVLLNVEEVIKLELGSVTTQLQLMVGQIVLGIVRKIVPVIIILVQVTNEQSMNCI